MLSLYSQVRNSTRLTQKFDLIHEQIYLWGSTSNQFEEMATFKTPSPHPVLPLKMQ